MPLILSNVDVIAKTSIVHGTEMKYRYLFRNYVVLFFFLLCILISDFWPVTFSDKEGTTRLDCWHFFHLWNWDYASGTSCLHIMLNCISKLNVYILKLHLAGKLETNFGTWNQLFCVLKLTSWRTRSFIFVLK